MASTEEDLRTISAKEAEIYDRQLRVWGVDGQQRIASARVLLGGMHALNAEVAKNLIESEFGNPVEITEVDENDAMFTGLADGTLDAVLEIWPSGVTDAETAFIDDGSVVDLGELGAIGKIGWFVPQYVIDDNPDLKSWEGFKDPATAAIFATAETGDNGRFLGTDPSCKRLARVLGRPQAAGALPGGRDGQGRLGC